MYEAMARQPNHLKGMLKIKGRAAEMNQTSHADEDARALEKINKKRRAKGQEEIPKPLKKERKIPGRAESQIDPARARSGTSRASSRSSSHRE